MAHSIETHYDILKVMRNAPVDVIKASYRVMSQKYHPDRNRDPGALDLMQRINQAWDVLRDPERRATHDRWIATQERKLATPSAVHAAE
ncbi:J domain-containing protein [Massilia sp. H-1]|nr:J domain-containing protein [Massilia sp. H-1]